MPCRRDTTLGSWCIRPNALLRNLQRRPQCHRKRIRFCRSRRWRPQPTCRQRLGWQRCRTNRRHHRTRQCSMPLQVRRQRAPSTYRELRVSARHRDCKGYQRRCHRPFQGRCCPRRQSGCRLVRCRLWQRFHVKTCRRVRPCSQRWGRQRLCRRYMPTGNQPSSRCSRRYRS